MEMDIVIVYQGCVERFDSHERENAKQRFVHLTQQGYECRIEYIRESRPQPVMARGSSHCQNRIRRLPIKLFHIQ